MQVNHAPNKPFLDNKGLFGMDFKQSKQVKELEIKVSANRRRSNRVSSLKRKNFELSQQIKPFMSDPKLSDTQIKYLAKLSKNINLCACNSLYREHLSNGAVEYIGSHTCDHKLCNVCNSLRQKRIRRKYMQFFQDTPTLFLLQNLKSKRVRAVTLGKYNQMKEKKDFKDKYSFVREENYELMHLTLTVPHYKESGFRGEKYYYDELIRMFNFLRKKEKWNKLVYGGEYGVETTNSSNGLNIHMHSLLLVAKGQQNRNTLHKYILQQWNRMTANPYVQRDKFSEGAISKILKSNRLLDREFVNKLDPKGSSIITLEGIYNKDENGNKQRASCADLSSEAVIKAVTEAISYHFEPQCFNKDSEQYDLDLMLDIMPVLEGKPLYRKFGCLHGEKSLNIRVTNEERVEDDFNESGQNLVINPETLQEADREEYEFFMVNPVHIYHDKEHNFRPVISHRAVKQYISEAPDTIAALEEMTRITLGKMYKGDVDETEPLQVDALTSLISKWDKSVLDSPPPLIEPSTIHTEINWQLRASTGG